GLSGVLTVSGGQVSQPSVAVASAPASTWTVPNLLLAPTSENQDSIVAATFRQTYGNGDLRLITDDDGKVALVNASTGAKYALPTINTAGTLNVTGSDLSDQIRVDHVTGIAPGGD